MRNAKEAVRDLWELEYKVYEFADTDTTSYGEGQRQSRDGEPDFSAEFVPPPGFYDNQVPDIARDEYDDYLKIPVARHNSPLEWWRQHEEQYPALSKMAFDLLSVPLMSAECEKVFLAAKLLITDKRNRMKDDVIEVCTLLRHWLKEGGTI